LLLRLGGRFVVDISGQRVGSVFKGRDDQDDILALEDRKDTLLRNVDKRQAYDAQQPRRSKIYARILLEPEEGKFQLSTGMLGTEKNFETIYQYLI
jgi:hypothetical protein